jgi:hypothetical protein
MAYSLFFIHEYSEMMLSNGILGKSSKANDSKDKDECHILWG